MDCVTPSGNVYQAGTLSGNPLAMHVGLAQLTYLKQHPEVYVELEKENKKKLAQGFDAILRKYKVDAQVVQMGSLMTIFLQIKN